MTEGHLHVVRGDLTRLASDAVLLPTDRARNLTRAWWDVLPQGHLVSSYAGWKRYEGPLGAGLDHDAAPLPDGRHWLFDTVHDEPQELVARVRAAVARVGRASEAGGDRVRPLVSLPLPGTGEGGLAHRRGAVVEHLLPALREVAAAGEVDVALVLADDRDAAAVQAVRDRAAFWTALPDHLRDEADRLGVLAAAGRLSLFIGAGVSKPLGLPDWSSLVAELRRQAELPVTTAPLPDAAQEAVAELGRRTVLAQIRDVFTIRSCTLAHALLADLRIREAVTTNYDTAYEEAVSGLHPHRGDDAVKVLTRTVVDPDRPWLLKLHGDARSGRGIVLTREQYRDFETRGVPLRGMVQNLLMTSHLLFVGYSLVDETFVLLAQQVRDVLRDTEEPRGYVGTVLPIAQDADLRARCGHDLAYVPMPVPAEQAPDGARLLEIFLDRLAWRASQLRLDAMQYLLDDRYEEVTRPQEDQRLREVAQRLLRETPVAARRSAGWTHLATALRRLGADHEDLGPS